jgi:hypothetical protein
MIFYFTYILKSKYFEQDRIGGFVFKTESNHPEQYIFTYLWPEVGKVESNFQSSDGSYSILDRPTAGVNYVPFEIEEN